MYYDIPKFRSSHAQPLLWDEPLRGHGHIRTVVGDLAERMTCERMGGRRLKTDARCEYCPDVQVGRMYFECKAVGRSGQLFVYAGRLAKDRAFAAVHVLWYAVWRHRADTKGCRTVAELEAAVRASVRCLYVMPFSAVDAACATVEERPLNSKYGRGGDQNYGSGFRVPLSRFAEWMV